MIKFSAGIAYEQNRPTGVASALIAQFGFLVKGSLSVVQQFFPNRSCYKSHYTTFGAKFFFDCSTGLASALTAKLGFLPKSALKMRCTKNFYRKKLLQMKSHNFYVM